MQPQHKTLLKALIKAQVMGELPQTLSSLTSAIQPRCSELLGVWNIYLCRYMRTKQLPKAKQILDIIRKVLHLFTLQGEQVDPYLPILISNNSVALAESEWNFFEAEGHLEAMLEYIDACIEKVLGREEPEFVRAAELKRLEVKVRLQLAGVYSQLQKYSHEKAAAIADSAIRLIYEFCLNVKMHVENLEIPKEFNLHKYNDKIEFLISQSDPEKLVSDPELEKVRMQLYAWKQNTEISSKHMRKLIPGRATTNSSLSGFQIGDIMEVTPMLSFELPTKQSILDLLATEQLEELVVELSVGYFTLGTELYYQKSKKGKNTIDKYKDTFQHPYKKEQLFHLAALQLAIDTIGFQTVYVEHLIKVFGDNYYNLQMIEQTIREESQSSIRVDQIKPQLQPMRYLSGIPKVVPQESATDSLSNSFETKTKKPPISPAKNERRVHISPPLKSLR